MAATDFAALTDEQYTVWSRMFWREARNKTFIMNFAGGEDSMIQRVTELRSKKDGARAVLTLIHDSAGDGVVGDNQLKGNESIITADERVIRIDQWREAHKDTGRMSNQKSIINFREVAKNNLSYTAARVVDELAFLTLSGVAYTQKPDGTTRTGSQLPLIEFGADVTAPTARRHRRWDVATGLMAGDTTQVDALDLPSWKMLVDLKAYAVNEFIRPIRSSNGIESYNVFMTPDGIARLKKDADFLDAWKHAQARGDENPIFKGTPHGGRKGIHIDGLSIFEYRNVYHPSTWGAGAVRGQRVLLCGAQAMGFADIGNAGWDEEIEDYGNVYGISTRKMFGMLKPWYYSMHSQTTEDFSVICCDTAV